jgi:PAS domain S-box-containing protein
MAHRDPSSPTSMPTILRYGIAVLSVATAIGLGFFVLRHFEAILTPFLFAVAVTVWYAGTGPGVLATVLSVLSLNYFFLRPSFSFSPFSYADLVYLTFCTFCALAVGWVSTVRRRTEQELRRAREELDAKVVERTANLQRSEGYLAEAQKLTHTGSWAWDPRTEKVLYCSEEMFRIFGLDPQESLPSRDNFRQQIHPDDRDWVKEAFEESLRERVDTFAEYRVLLPNGTVRHINASGHPVLNEDDELIEFVGTAVDVTERKRAEAALRDMQMELAHANRVVTMSQLSASIAQEVKQPITAAVTYALAARRWLSAEPPNFREADAALSLIVKEGNRAGEVVGRIPALIKKVPVRKDAVVINDAIFEVIALTRTEAANNGVPVRTQLAEGLPRVQGDRAQLQQVLINLIINAVEAMRDVGEQERDLLISSRNEPDGVSVEVRDSGPGFTPADLERVFEAFRSTKPGGLGLGLSICRSIIEAHNGRLCARPNVPRGAIFSFIVPAHPAATP